MCNPFIEDGIVCAPQVYNLPIVLYTVHFCVRVCVCVCGGEYCIVLTGEHNSHANTEFLFIFMRTRVQCALHMARLFHWIFYNVLHWPFVRLVGLLVDTFATHTFMHA